MSKASSNKDAGADDKPKQPARDMRSLLSEMKAKHAADSPSGQTDAAQDAGEIPKFDLAQQIMAEQRKVAAVRRKGPGRQPAQAKQAPGLEPTSHAFRPPSSLPEQEHVIADIVARDIEELCRRGTG